MFFCEVLDIKDYQKENTGSFKALPFVKKLKRIPPGRTFNAIGNSEEFPIALKNL